MRNEIHSLAALLVLVACAHDVSGANGAPRKEGGYTMHTVFSAECTPYFDWQSIGLVRSHREVGMPGPITRLLACSPERLKDYKYLNIVPTHVHPNYGDLHMADLGDSYVPYNKPGSIRHWLETTNVTEDFVFFIDADMLFLKSVTPELVNARPGNAVSAAYDYLIGVDDPLVAPKFLEEQYRPLMRKVGGWTMMYTADMRKVAPWWFNYTEIVRTSPLGLEVWSKMGDSYVTKEFPRPWISEMYGYVFGAARAGVDHTVNRDMMLYPTYVPDDDPYILHYGLEVRIGKTYLYDKHHHTSADMLACPVKLFEQPPTVETAIAEMYPDRKNIPPKEEDRLRLAVHTVTALNDAIREHGQKYCPVCPADCTDDHEMCGTWKDAGECTKNKGYMDKTCRASCGVCVCGKAKHDLSERTRLTGALPSALLRGGATVASLKAETEREKATPVAVEDELPASSPPPPPPPPPSPTHVPSVVDEGQGDGAKARVERGLSEGASGEGAARAHGKRKGHRKAEAGAGLWGHYVRGALQFVATAAFFGLLSEMHRRRGLKARKAAKEERARAVTRAKKDGGDGEGKPPMGRQYAPDHHHGDDGVSDEDW